MKKPYKTREELEKELRDDLDLEDLYSTPAWLQDLIDRILNRGWKK